MSTVLRGVVGILMIQIVSAAELVPVGNLADGFQMPPRLLAFADEQDRLVKAQSEKLGVPAMPMALDYFEAARKGDWAQAMDLYKEVSEFLRAEANEEAQAKLDAITSQAALDVQLVLEAMVEGDMTLALSFGESIVKSLPPGSVYFGGTDPGRGLPTAWMLPDEKPGRRFVLTQASLISHRYREYVKAKYGDQLALPNRKDQEGAFNLYLNDAGRRLAHDEEFPNDPKQLLPGENVSRKDNRLSVGGQVAVMQINGILLKQMVDENPGREFFIEENYPVAWMYPHLTPHGLIMKLNRKVPERIAPELVEKDRAFWLEQQRGLIGEWLKPETSVKEVCAFAEKVFAKRELGGFSGNAKLVQNEKAGKLFSQPRGAIGGVYEWRAKNAKEKSERERMLKEADFAYRQAFAFCPGNSGVVMRYVNWLRANGRDAEAQLVAETAANVDPGNAALEKLVGK